MSSLPLLSVLVTAVLLNSCSATQHSSKPETIIRLKFLSEYDFPYNKNFQNTVTGGFSGIDYDAQKKIFYIISDDRSERNAARFYEAKILINEGRIDSVIFLDTKFFKTNSGNFYPNSHNDPYHTPDPEAIRYNAKNNTILWSSEGERIIKPDKVVLENPSVTQIDSDGIYIDTFILPPQLHMHVSESGPRQNETFEGLAFAEDYKSLFVSVEEPLYDDGPRAAVNDSTAIIRILKFDMASKKAIAQVAYRIDAVAHAPTPPGSFTINGVTDILSAAENKLFVVERSFSTGRLGCAVKLFLADLSNADNIEHIPSLKNKKDVKNVTKKLLLDMDSLGFYIDNIEGVTYGPRLPDGHRTLIFVSDNNFLPIQKTQFLLFEIE